MPKFVFVFRGGKPDSPEAGQKLMDDWNTWLTDLGGAVADPGAAVGMSTFVDSGGDVVAAGDPVSGYMIVETADLRAATAYAKASPLLSLGGSIEIAPVVQM
ncbi:YciI family protein [Devosia sp. CAU 1758]